MTNASAYTEKELLQQLSVGDVDAFRIIFEQHRDRLFSYARHVCKSVSTAEEITQDIFLKLWINREESWKIDSLSSYLHIACRNHTFNMLKRQAHESAILQELGNNQRQVSNSTEDAVRFTEYRQIIHQAVENLPLQQKQVFKLSRNEGLKTGEIAEKLGISPFTVKKHLVQSLKALRTQLGKKIEAGTLIIISIIFRL